MDHLKPNIASNIIAEAKQILLQEQLDVLSDVDIENIRENSLEKYKKKLNQILPPKPPQKICQSQHVSWDDEMFQTFIPNPKNNPTAPHNNDIKDYILKNWGKLPLEEINLKIDGAVNNRKFDGLMHVEIDQRITEKNREIENFLENCLEFTNFDGKHEKPGGEVEETKETSAPVENGAEIKEIPELVIIPQGNQKIEQFLEIKKINFDSDDISLGSGNHFENSETNSIPNVPKEIKTNKITNKKIENFVENLQKFKFSQENKSKSDLHNSKKPKITLKPKPKSSTAEPQIASFEFRFKAQKDIITQQKLKLDEQNRLIEDLKLNKIAKDVNESLKMAETNLHAISTTKYKYKLKPEVPEVVNPDPNGIGLSLNLGKAPKLVQKMEERAKIREEKRLLIRERKRLLELEKKKQAEDAIKKKMADETQEKQQRSELLRKQREKTRHLELRRQIEKQKFIELNEKALNFYRLKTIQNHGFKPLKMLLYYSRIKIEIGRRFYHQNLVQKQFQKWRHLTQSKIRKKMDLAQEHYKKTLLIKYFKQFKLLLFQAQQKNQVAQDRYEMALQLITFGHWHRYTCEVYLKHKINAERANKHYKRLLLFQCLHSWRSLPAILQIERVQNERKRKWRLRVSEILPDYDPTRNHLD